MIDYSDRGHLLGMLDLFQEYRPPNAADYDPSAVTDPTRLWPRTTTGWCIVHNTELVKDPPKGWWDITNPKYSGVLATPSGYTGGSTWVFPRSPSDAGCSRASSRATA